MNKRVAVFAVCVLLAAMMTGCQTPNPPKTEPQESVPPTETQQMTETTAVTETVESTEPTVINAFSVKTKYGYLFYQDQWENTMVVTQTEEDGCVTVAFEAQINDIRYPLFRFVIGQSEGDPVGYLTDAEGNRHSVFVYPEEIGEYAELTEGQQNRLYAMQEEINFIIENLK